VTETHRAGPASSTGSELQWEEVRALPVSDVEEVMAVLTKALRARQLYDPSNPVYRRFLASLQEVFRHVWGELDRLPLLVQEDRILWRGETVYRSESRTDSLSFLLYRDGIRDLTLLPGFEDAEIESFLDGLGRVRSQRGEGDDLTTILWDLDLEFLSYTAVDLGADGIDLPEPGVVDSGNTAGIDQAIQDLREEVAGESEAKGDGEGAAGEAGGPAGLARSEDFNPTLYALNEEERRRLRQELQREMERDVRTATITALLDALEDSPGARRQREIVEVLSTMLPALLGRGALAETALIVSEAGRLRGILTAEASEAVGRLLEELSTRESVAELVRVVEDGAVAADGRELAELLGALQPSALEALVRESEQALSDVVQGVLGNAMIAIGSVDPGRILRLLRSEDPAVVIGAVRLAGRMKLEEASGHLAEILDGGDLQTRLAAVQAAAGMRSTLLAGALQRLLQHENRELRVAAARVLGGMAYPPAAKVVRSVIEAREFRQADVSEKVAFFEAYGRIAGEGAIEFLESVLNGRGFLGRREPPEIRAGAALGLGQVDSDRARAALLQSRDDQDPVVKSAVGRALRGEGASDG